MEFKEITAKTVDEAITKACLEFETSSDNLEIQVVQEGTSGFLGFIGSKPAVIKVRKKVQEEEFDILKELAKEEKKEKKAPVKEEKKEPKKEIKKETKPVKEPKKGTVTKTQTENKEEKPVAKEAQPKPEPRKPVVRTEEQVQQMKQDAEKFLTGVFGAMELPVEITMNYDKRTDTGFSAVSDQPGCQQRAAGLCQSESRYRKLQKPQKRHAGKPGKKHCFQSA